jgi:hypothetical protein
MDSGCEKAFLSSAYLLGLQAYSLDDIQSCERITLANLYIQMTVY